MYQPTSALPRPFGRAGNDDATCGTFSRNRCRSVPAVCSVVGMVVRLRFCGAFACSMYGSTPEEFPVVGTVEPMRFLPKVLSSLEA